MAMDLSRTKIVVSGGKGQLARSFALVAARQGLDLTALGRDKLDISDHAQVLKILEDLRPGVFINCASYNEVDLAETSSDEAFRVNRDALGQMVEVCRNRKIFLVHFSTDYVFDGTKDSPYSEEDAPAPLSVYGRSKLAGEELVIRGGLDHLVYRVSWLYGPGERNFLFKLRNWLTRADLVRITTDEISVPTYSMDVASFVLASLRRGLCGLFHLPNTGYCSRYDLARYFCAEMKLKKTIHPARRDEFFLPAQRPAFSAMSNARVIAALKTEIPSWQDAVTRYCRLLKTDAEAI
jgi:dTDP-4-dehydrorhamnose reductase